MWGECEGSYVGVCHAGDGTRVGLEDLFGRSWGHLLLRHTQFWKGMCDYTGWTAAWMRIVPRDAAKGLGDVEMRF
jgi:hypothetical protein